MQGEDSRDVGVLIMLNLIFCKDKACGKKVIIDSRPYFRQFLKKEWFSDSVVQNIIKLVDNSECMGDYVIKNSAGELIPPEWLSTGVKTAILIWKFPDIIFNLTQCGNNALACVASICKVYERTELTYRYLPWVLLEDIEVRKDNILVDHDKYYENIDSWLEECLND